MRVRWVLDAVYDGWNTVYRDLRCLDGVLSDAECGEPV